MAKSTKRKMPWKPEFIVRTYQLAREGMTQNQIALTLGTTKTTFLNWKQRHPELRAALREGCVTRKRAGTFTFRDYIYDQLPAKCQETWDEINRFEKAENRQEKVKALLERRGMRIRQYLFMYAWVSETFSLNRALRKLGISYYTYRMWKLNDPMFHELIEAIEFYKKNFFEEHLCRLVRRGDPAATIFVNRTKNRDRGYGEHVDHSVDASVDHRISSIDTLDLSLEARKEILEKLRNKKHVESREVPALTGPAVQSREADDD